MSEKEKRRRGRPPGRPRQSSVSPSPAKKRRTRADSESEEEVERREEVIRVGAEYQVEHVTGLWLENSEPPVEAPPQAQPTLLWESDRLDPALVEFYLTHAAALWKDNKVTVPSSTPLASYLSTLNSTSTKYPGNIKYNPLPLTSSTSSSSSAPSSSAPASSPVPSTPLPFRFPFSADLALSLLHLCNYEVLTAFEVIRAGKVAAVVPMPGRPPLPRQHFADEDIPLSRTRRRER